MKRMLKKVKQQELYYYENGIKILGVHSKITGDISGLTGNISGLTGNISGLTGDISFNIEGNIDLCKITEEERIKGVDIRDLIVEE